MHSFAAIKDFIQCHPRLLVITGAGISAASGIPTYRSDAGEWQHKQPIQHQEFISQHRQRQRYWARSAVGWHMVATATPNDAHKALVQLESSKRISLLVTQNVDRLHQRAGHRHVVDLHGRLDRVICLSCGADESRGALQYRLLEKNRYLDGIVANAAPDGDADVDDDLVDSICPPECLKCGGVLMPDVVFYGGTVPRLRVEQVMCALHEADAVLAIGSSLMVYSVFRFCKAAREQGKAIAAINRGKTRADELLSVKVEEDCADVLMALAAC